MTQTIAIDTDGNTTEFKLMKMHENTDRKYRLDINDRDIQILFDSVEYSGKEFSFKIENELSYNRKESTFPDRIVGALGALASEN